MQRATSASQRIVALVVSVSLALSVPIPSHAEGGDGSGEIVFRPQAEAPTVVVQEGGVDFRPDIAISPLDAAQHIGPTRELDEDELLADAQAYDDELMAESDEEGLVAETEVAVEETLEVEEASETEAEIDGGAEPAVLEEAQPVEAEEVPAVSEEAPVELEEAPESDADGAALAEAEEVEPTKLEAIEAEEAIAVEQEGESTASAASEGTDPSIASDLEEQAPEELAGELEPMPEPMPDPEPEPEPMSELAEESEPELEPSPETEAALEEPALSPQAKAVKDYSYAVTPLLSPFNNLLYVKTDNPDPKSFCITDKATKYLAKGESTSFVLLDYDYYDIVYENASTRRVKGGYVFYDYDCQSDGGTLHVQANVNGTFSDTGKTVSCAALKDGSDYLIDTYAKGKTAFFDKLDAVQSGLHSISVYPRGLMDTSKPNPELPYPFLAASPYQELSLNDHVGETFEDYDGYLFLSSLHPFVLDSLGFPSTMYAVAKRLGYTGEYESGSNHWQVSITYGGETRSYGWAGQGGSGPIFSKDVSKSFTFDGATSDLGTHASIKTLTSRYLGLCKKADEFTADMYDQVAGEAFNKAIGAGTWIRVQREGWGYAQRYAYVADGPDGGTNIVSDAWVDGHYVDAWETLVRGEKFADHPHAAIVKRNMSYTDYDGNKHKNDVVFVYDSDTNTWRAPYYYSGAWWYSNDMTLPSQFILTEAQVKALKPDANTNRLPTSGLIYDGTVKPGTPFSGTAVTGVTLPATKTVWEGDDFSLAAQFKPANATNKTGDWSCSDETVASFVEGYYSQKVTLHAEKPGTVTLTFVADDGGFKASSRVTVRPWFYDVYHGHWAESVIKRAVSYGLMSGYASGNFGPEDSVTRGQVAVMLWNMAGRPKVGAGAKSFPDVARERYYYNAVRWASGAGVVSGYANGTFGPENKVTREQLAVMLANYAKRVAKRPVSGSASDYSTMKDARQVSSWARGAVGWCYRNKILSGSNGNVKPQGNATRAQAAKMFVILHDMLK